MGHISALFIYVVLGQGSKVMLYYECSKLGYANSNTLNQGVRNRKLFFLITRFKDALKCKGL